MTKNDKFSGSSIALLFLLVIKIQVTGYLDKKEILH